jgi:hypothetical protein
MDHLKQLTELNSFVRRAQRVLADYLPPDSNKTADDTLSELLGILDNRELHRLQEKIPAKPALFAVE